MTYLLHLQFRLHLLPLLLHRIKIAFKHDTPSLLFPGFQRTVSQNSQSGPRAVSSIRLSYKKPPTRHLWKQCIKEINNNSPGKTMRKVKRRDWALATQPFMSKNGSIKFSDKFPNCAGQLKSLCSVHPPWPFFTVDISIIMVNCARWFARFTIIFF